MKQNYYLLLISLLFGLGYSQEATHLNFDGNNDVVNCGNDSSVQISGNQLTLEAWIRAETFKSSFNDGTIINKEQNMPDNGYMIRVGGSGQVNFNIGNGSWHEITSPSNSIFIGTWHHIAATYDGTTMTIYVDGNVVASSTSFNGNIGNSTANLRIGNIGNLTRCFDGDIDEARVWNVARSQSEIQNNMDCVSNTSPGLVAYYKFNQGVSSINNDTVNFLNDETVNENNGTLSNFALSGTSSNWLAGSTVVSLVVPSAMSPVVYQIGDTASPLIATSGETGLLWYTSAAGGIGSTTAPTPSTTTVGTTSYWVSSTNATGCESNRFEIIVEVNPVPPGSYLNFDGVNDFVISANAVTTNTQNQTYQAWFKIPSIPVNTDRILQRGNDGTGGWSVQLSVDPTGKLSAGIESPGIYVTGTTTLLPNTWYQATFVFENNNSIRLYLDGILEGSTVIGNMTLRNSDNRLRIGQGNIAAEYFNGNIDEVRVWSLALTVSEILSTKDCELMGNEAGLVTYYQFNEGFDQADNSTVTSMSDISSNGNDGTLTNFTLNGAISNWLASSPISTPEMPDVNSPVVYNEGDSASPLTATTGTNGTGLMWYTVATGGTGSTTAPTPSTTTVGNTSYWVASTNANGCESERVEIVVQVEAVTNDLCINATPLTVGMAFTDYPVNVDLTGATDSGVSDVGCGYYLGGDRWYTAVIPSSGNLIIETFDANYNDTVIEVFAGSDCDSMFDVGCDDNNGVDDYSKVIFNGAPAGETVYIRVYEYGTANSLAQFQISAYEPYYNICADTTPLTVGATFTDFPASVDLTGATDSGVPEPYCANYSGGDMWFTAVIPSSGNIVIETDGANGNDTGLSVYLGNCDNDLYEIDCNDDNNNGYSYLEFNGLPAGQTLYIRVWEYGEGNSTIQFEVSAYDTTVPYNICADTTLLTVGTVFTDFPQAVDLTGATDSGVSEPDCASYQGGDMWFTAVVPGSGNLTVETYGVNGDDTGLAIYTGDCNNNLTEIDCNDDYNSGYSYLELTNLTPGETVYIRVWEYGTVNPSIQFEVSVYDNTPPYNICADVTALTVGAVFTDYPQTVDLTGATDSGVSDPGCASYSGGDMWFSAVVPASGTLTVETDGANDNDTGLAVYSGNCNNALLFIDCSDDNSDNPNFDYYSKLELIGLTAGETVYIRVWEYGEGNPTIQFEVSAYDASLNTNSFVKNTISVYPNPSNGYYTLDTNEELSVNVYDLVGKLIYTNKAKIGSNQIDISNYAAGIYLMNYIDNSGKTNTVKLIKN